MNNLCLHSGAIEATFEQVEAVAVPEATKTWVPVPHHEVIRRVEDAAKQMSLEVTNKRFALWADGARMFSLLELKSDKPDYGMIIGLRNSHDQSFSVGLSIGNRVFVCDNLSFTGEVVVHHKHTARVLQNLPLIVNRALGLLCQKRLDMERRIETYKQFELTPAQAHDTIMRGLRAGVLTTTRIPQVLHEWDEPTYEDFKPRNLWSLYNAHTEVLKVVNPVDLTRRTIALNGVCDLTAGLIDAVDAGVAELQSEVGDDALVSAGL